MEVCLVPFELTPSRSRSEIGGNCHGVRVLQWHICMHTSRKIAQLQLVIGYPSVGANMWLLVARCDWETDNNNEIITESIHRTRRLVRAGSCRMVRLYWKARYWSACSWVHMGSLWFVDCSTRPAGKRYMLFSTVSLWVMTFGMNENKFTVS